MPMESFQEIYDMLKSDRMDPEMAQVLATLKLAENMEHIAKQLDEIRQQIGK